MPEKYDVDIDDSSSNDIFDIALFSPDTTYIFTLKYPFSYPVSASSGSAGASLSNKYTRCVVSFKNFKKTRNRLSEEDDQVQRKNCEEVTEELLTDWQNYWTESGQQICWKRWFEKFKDYVNPDFKILDFNSKSYSSDSDEDENRQSEFLNSCDHQFDDECNEDELEQTQPCTSKLTEQDRQNIESNTLWQAAWEDHCQKEYTEEYFTFCSRYQHHTDVVSELEKLKLSPPSTEESLEEKELKIVRIELHSPKETEEAFRNQGLYYDGNLNKESTMMKRKREFEKISYTANTSSSKQNGIGESLDDIILKEGIKPVPKTYDKFKRRRISESDNDSSDSYNQDELSDEDIYYDTVEHQENKNEKEIQENSSTTVYPVNLSPNINIHFRCENDLDEGENFRTIQDIEFGPVDAPYIGTPREADAPNFVAPADVDAPCNDIPADVNEIKETESNVVESKIKIKLNIIPVVAPKNGRPNTHIHFRYDEDSYEGENFRAIQDIEFGPVDAPYIGTSTDDCETLQYDKAESQEEIVKSTIETVVPVENRPNTHIRFRYESLLDDESIRTVQDSEFSPDTPGTGIEFETNADLNEFEESDDPVAICVAERPATDTSLSDYEGFAEGVVDTTKRKKIKFSSPKGTCKPKRHLLKYWIQRYHLFSKFDEGIKLDDESWYSATMEEIAALTATRVKITDVVIDGFCGCGGNTIQFAMKCQKVIAVDIDPIKLEYAKHNAKIYGVEDKIEFILGDFMLMAPMLKGDIVFLSPPWGGPNYTNAFVFDIQTMIPMDGIKLYNLSRKISKNIIYYLPRNVDNSQVIGLAEEGEAMEIQKHMIHDKVKTITVYFGDLVELSDENELSEDDLPEVHENSLTKEEDDLISEVDEEGLPALYENGLPEVDEVGLQLEDEYGLPEEDEYGLQVEDEYGLQVEDEYGLPEEEEYGLPEEDEYGLPKYDEYDLPEDEEDCTHEVDEDDLL